MSDIDGLEMKTRVDEILNRHPALGFALGVVRNGSLEFFHTHGFADLASNRPVAEDTVFRIASITKTLQWMPVEMSRLLHDLLGVPDAVIPTDVPQRPEIWGDICGWYYLPGPLTDVRLRTIAGAGVEVFVRRGQLVLRFLTPIPALYRGFPLHPTDDTDPYVFRMDLSEFGLGPFTVVFSSKPKTEAMAVHFDVMPLSAQRQPQRTNPRLWVEGALALSTMAILSRRLLRTRHHRKT